MLSKWREQNLLPLETDLEGCEGVRVGTGASFGNTRKPATKNQRLPVCFRRLRRRRPPHPPPLDARRQYATAHHLILYRLLYGARYVCRTKPRRLAHCARFNAFLSPSAFAAPDNYLNAISKAPSFKGALYS